jgi:hypothetical protein
MISFEIIAEANGYRGEPDSCLRIERPNGGIMLKGKWAPDS